jgi:carbon-monoxide dehydrogenase medium subunit
MKPAPFKYASPPTLSSAIKLLTDNADDAKLLAGGQSLIPAMNFRLIQPTMLIDLNQLSNLDYITLNEDKTVKIGALTRQRSIERSQLVRQQLPLLHEAMPFIAHSQIRNRGTLGGSLVHADPAAELPVIFRALGGRLRLRNQNGERWLSADECFTGIFTTDLNPDEILTEVEFPQKTPGQGWSFMEFARRKGDYALMGVAVLLTLDQQGLCRGGRLVYLNSGEIPTVATQASQMLEGEKPTDKLFEEVARTAAFNEIKPSANIHASGPYLRNLAEVITKRALKIAVDRAQSLSRA